MFWNALKVKLKAGVRRLSLSLRLSLIFLAVALLVWLVSGLVSWREGREHLDEFFDSYQLLLAYQLSAADWRNVDQSARPGPFKGLEKEGGSDGEADDEALGFAVFDADGRLLFSDGENGRRFPFDPAISGFVERKLSKGGRWRLVYIKSPDASVSAVVGQRLKYRSEAAGELAAELLAPWLLGLLFLGAASLWLVHWELRPLKKIAADLSGRAPGDLNPLDGRGLPGEVAPLALALNDLFQRQQKLLERERAFVSDAAHELRSPLTALKVQTEVAQLSSGQPEALARALAQMNTGIDRTARLLEQLLALSRLEGGAAAEEPQILDWDQLLREAVAATEGSGPAPVKIIRRAEPRLKAGRLLLMSLMLGNLLDNARRYSSPGAEIEIILDGPLLSVTNSGVNIAPEHLARLGERFFRPPGQEPAGSGLGLSIVKKVAELHGGRIECRFLPPDRFSVYIEAG